MNTFLPEHSSQDSPAFEQGMYDWSENVHMSAPQAPYNGVSMRTSYPEHEFSMTAGPQFQYTHSLQRPSFGALTQVGDVDYRGSSPHSAPPSSGNSPWNTGSIPTQEVMYHPDVELAKFNRGSRGSMNSLSLASMRTSHPHPGGHAYTSKIGMRPHAMSVSNMGHNDEQPWNLIPCAMPFAQDGLAGSGGIPGVAGTSFFLRSPTPTKRQRTNQACEKCRERKAKCNGARPTCQRCAARGHICEYAKERRMRGPNKTGRRGSQADIEDPVDSPGRPVTALDPDVSETGTQRDESPASSRPDSRRSSSEATQGEPGSASAIKSSSRSPEPQSGASVPIALPTLSHGNLNLQSYSADARRMPSESVIRYAQSMPQIGYRYGPSHDGFAGSPTWNSPVDGQTMTSLNIPAHEDAASSDYPTAEMQTLHYSVSDVSSSSTPITPERFEYAWPTADGSSPQQNAFAFVHNDKPQPMLPIPEFEGESNSLGELRVWTGSHSDKHPIMMPSGPENDHKIL
ncbi:unnamed protein product [Rhizoctonia solani]|uniref:Fungal Zn(2)-cys(6) binuclear cluster domain protein n=1 Tax=Rhizoctonia solani AG-3 Rhs1AP TaxID=1086054 RepID=X8JRD9_9AGAM|nr:fungal Zn(2)-cys(6) binuclear cluster domain protein [Rhizoctonia solani AG-3 Rhs1AP]CAE6527867.1 unnamed protein product [Rhizoctonia solani]